MKENNMLRTLYSRRNKTLYINAIDLYNSLDNEKVLKESIKHLIERN